jgi:hypothetical protein
MSLINRPFRYGPDDRRVGLVYTSELEIRVEQDASGNPVYIGRAIVGTAEDEPKWQISFHTWSAEDSLLTKKWAENASGNASTDYEFTWDDRATYTYS